MYLIFSNVLRGADGLKDDVQIVRWVDNPPYNEGYNDNLLVTIECYGIDYFVREINDNFSIPIIVSFSEIFC